ncbi:SIMPL domain-containing protein [Arthrobacter mobilis]|uniref:SIMPL domain-containing protein n=1 Tax=Arthrobacter mobilis TaxID=2724944 RepID=A0A7X6HHG5_9MICC|nr:SIMPL domain-containing protein [Arthrobacter mobilis]NKX56121.1 SIMPL domain-containing protein [Arthrobacter mobilis]
MNGSSTASGITVTGTGSASGTPDLLTFSLAVETTAADLAEAYRRTADAAGWLLAALHREGLAGGDTATSGIRLRPETVWHEGGRQETTGYTASADFAVTVRVLEQASGVLEAAVAAAGDALRVGGISYGFSDPASLAAAAREAAWRDARGKAGQLAGLAGRALGAVVRIEEAAGGAPVPLHAVREAALPAGAMPVAPGPAEVPARLTVTWAWGPDRADGP